MDNLKLQVCEHELNFRNELFRGDHAKILDLDIRCTVCSANLNWMMLFKKQILKHPFLEVILCEACLESNKCRDWAEGCLWCGLQRSDVIRCCYCPVQFCEGCIRVNYGFRGIIKARLSGWKCLICKKKNLNILRAVCDAAETFTNELKKLDNPTLKNNVTECSCCKAKFKTITQLNCGHKFHHECLNEWTKKNQNCPLCRAKVSIQTKKA